MILFKTKYNDKKKALEAINSKEFLPRDHNSKTEGAYYPRKMSVELRNDKVVMAALINKFNWAIDYIGPNLREDKEFVLFASSKPEFGYYENLSQKFKNDKDVAFTMISSMDVKCIPYWGYGTVPPRCPIYKLGDFFSEDVLKDERIAKLIKERIDERKKSESEVNILYAKHDIEELEKKHPNIETEKKKIAEKYGVNINLLMEKTNKTEQKPTVKTQTKAVKKI